LHLTIPARCEQLNANHNGFDASIENLAQNWTLDATGNWSEFKQGAWSIDQDRSHDAANQVGVISGTCGNMAALHVALGWRLGWPLSLACAGSHYICRYDDGKKVFNIEATVYGDGGGFSSPPDEHYIQKHKLPKLALDCGSDLRSVTPLKMLALFLGLRARHLENIG
jgi:hypothetical protein